MASTTGSLTSVSLMEQLRVSPADPGAWARFVNRYGPKIHGWCRHWGLQPADAEDVTQDVLRQLFMRFANVNEHEPFKYDGGHSFRSYLKTAARNAWVKWKERQSRFGQGAGDSGVLSQLLQVEAREDLLHHLAKEFDVELQEEAMRVVQASVEPRTWEAFRLGKIEGLSGKEIEARIGMKVGTVYATQSRVMKQVIEEARKLEGPQGEAS